MTITSIHSNNITENSSAWDNWFREHALYIINVLVCLMACGIFLRVHFSDDGYAREINGFAGEPTGMLRNGRFAAHIIEWTLYALHLENLRNNGLFTFIFIIMSGIASAALAYRILRLRPESDIWDILLVDLGTLLTVVNAFITEWYIFSECMDFYIFAMAGAIGAAVLISNSDGRDRWRHLILGILCLMVSYNSYQIGLGIYVFCVMLLIWLQEGGVLTRGFVRSTYIAAGSAILVVAVNMICVRIMTTVVDMGDSRYGNISLENIRTNISSLVAQLPTTWIHANNQLQPGIFPFVACILVLVLFVNIGTQQEDLHVKISRLCAIAMVIIGGGTSGIYPAADPGFPVGC